MNTTPNNPADADPSLLGRSPFLFGATRRRAARAAAGALAVTALLSLAACGTSSGADTSADAGDTDTADTTDTAEATGATLELGLGDGGAMASCMAVDAAILADMSPAFGATVTAVDGEEVTLDVDTWYAGTDEADTVTLHADQGMEALIGGIDFQVGEQYLITATDGNVNYCGYSGPADATLSALYAEAFGG